MTESRLGIEKKPLVTEGGANQGLELQHTAFIQALGSSGNSYY